MRILSQVDGELTSLAVTVIFRTTSEATIHNGVRVYVEKRLSQSSLQKIHCEKPFTKNPFGQKVFRRTPKLKLVR